MAVEKIRIEDDIWHNLPEISRFVNAKSLASSTAETETVPSGVDTVFICYSAGTLYIDDDATAAVPGDVTNGSAAEIIHSGSSRRVFPAQTLSVINATACVVTFAYSNSGRSNT